MKNKLMRAATILMVLTLMTSCFVGSTFAKYTTSSAGTDTARVAYWGFEAPADMAIDLFDDAYSTDVKSVGNVGGFTNVIAPGTAGDHTFGFVYTNYQTDKITAPEVAYTFTVDATGTCDDLIKANTNIIWKLDGVAAKDPSSTYADGTFDALLAAIENLSGEADGSVDYDFGELPPAFEVGDTHVVGWEWLIGANTADDIRDTTMGNADILDDVSLTITITATQINS